MSTGKIRTYNDLLEEEQRMLMQYKRDRAKLMEDMNELKNKFQPAEQFFHKINKWFQVPPAQHFFPKILDIGLDLFSKKFLFKNSGWIKTFLGSYVLRILSQWIMGTVMQKKEKKKNYDGTEETLNQ